MRRTLESVVTGSFLLSLMLGVGPYPAWAQQNPIVKFAQEIKFPQVFTGANITISAQDANVPVLSGTPTFMWTLGGVWPPPTIRRPTGNQSNVTFVHNLQDIIKTLPDHDELTIHHHGSHVAPTSDGWACGFFIRPGESRTYVYPLKESDAANSTGNGRGVTEWYHNHRVDGTGQTAWMGLAGGMFIIDDPADPQTLPSGKYDVTLALQDRVFDKKNQITPFSNGVGNVILVNGVPWPYMNVDTHWYRFRVLNPSNNRRYGLQLQDSAGNVIPLLQIAGDSGLLPKAVSRDRIPIGIAERVEFLINFGPDGHLLGQNLTLKSVGEPGASGDLTDVMQFRVTTQVEDRTNLPDTLRAVPGIVTPVNRRSFTFDLTTFDNKQASNDGLTGTPHGTLFTVNGKAMDCNRTDANPRLNRTEEWTLANGGTTWIHSIHIHDVDQVCVSRNGGPCGAFELLKETWPMLGGETIVVQLTPTDFTQDTLADGRYMLHCHVLNHEDLAMMTQWQVIP